MKVLHIISSCLRLFSLWYMTYVICKLVVPLYLNLPKIRRYAEIDIVERSRSTVVASGFYCLLKSSSQKWALYFPKVNPQGAEWVKINLEFAIGCTGVESIDFRILCASLNCIAYTTPHNWYWLWWEGFYFKVITHSRFFYGDPNQCPTGTNPK